MNLKGAGVSVGFEEYILSERAVDIQRPQDMKIIFIQNFQSLITEFRLVDLYSFTKYIVAFKMWSTCCIH